MKVSGEIGSCKFDRVDYSHHMGHNLTALSLFCSGGIGDLAAQAAGWDVIAANELLPDRAAIFRANFPNTAMVVGDINQVVEQLRRIVDKGLASRTLDVIFATPPCQGMSKNGMGKLLREAREGRREGLDPRNQLVIPVVDLVERYRPRLLVMENVPEMARTIIDTDMGVETIEAFLHRRLQPLGYTGAMETVEFADFGVPQRRKRLLTLFTRDARLRSAIRQAQWLPERTHSQQGDLLSRSWRTVMDAIGHLPPLDARDEASATSSYHPLHRVPLLDADKYLWVSHTPAGATAFDNQCVAPGCSNNDNSAHRTARGSDGINQASKSTPVRCRSCNALLQRPWTIKDGEHHIMSGFTSAYKRMRGDLPASALTRNLSYACSDQKLHPTQHRVLSLHEAEIIHTINQYSWRWVRDDGRTVSHKLIREIIGESVPPKGLEAILSHLTNLLTPKVKATI